MTLLSAILLCITPSNYDIAVFLVNSLKLLTKCYNQHQINSGMAKKQEQARGDHLWRSCSLFLVGIFHSFCRRVKYPYTRLIHMTSTK